MYKHILVPTDGSRLSTKAIRMAVKLADVTGAKVTGVFVIAPFVASVYGDGIMYGSVISPKRYKELTRGEARKALAVVELEARAGGVRYAPKILTARNPWEGIVRGAKSMRADLIVMASRGRRGLGGLVLGSETVKVLTHTNVPVLVCH